MLNLTLHSMKKNKQEILCTKAHKACCSHISSLLIFLYFAHLSSCPLHCHPHTMEQQLLVVLTGIWSQFSSKVLTEISCHCRGFCLKLKEEMSRDMLPGRFGSILPAFNILFYWTSVKVVIVLLCPLNHSMFCINFFFHLSPLPFSSSCIIVLFSPMVPLSY